MIVNVVLLCSCSLGTSSAKKAAQNLEGNFTCELDFIMSGNEQNLSGGASLTKQNDIITLTFHSPSQYENMVIVSDETGAPDVLSLEYFDIPAKVPKQIMSDISHLLFMFSDSFSHRLENADRDSIKEKSQNEMLSSFSFDGGDYIVGYTKETGTPTLVEGEKDGMSQSIVITDFNVTD